MGSHVIIYVLCRYMYGPLGSPLDVTTFIATWDVSCTDSLLW